MFFWEDWYLCVRFQVKLHNKAPQRQHTLQTLPPQPCTGKDTAVNMFQVKLRTCSLYPPNPAQARMQQEIDELQSALRKKERELESAKSAQVQEVERLSIEMLAAKQVYY